MGNWTRKEGKKHLLLNVQLSEILTFNVTALYHEYFKLCIPLEPVIPLLRIPGINQSVLYNFENGK